MLFLKMGRSYLNPGLYKDELLGSDFFVRGRAFASVVPINKGYLVYYSKINRFDKNITINLRKVKISKI